MLCGGSARRTPGDEVDGDFQDFVVDEGVILGVPNDEAVVGAGGSQELVIVREGEVGDLIPEASEDLDWFAGLEVPENDWGFRGFGVFGAQLAGGQELAGLADSESTNIHIVSAEENLLMLVVEIFDCNKTS